MLTNKMLRSAVSVAVLTGVLVGTNCAAMAESQWQKNHPRRNQVNGRLANQNHRINQERQADEITQQQARTLHKQDRQIRQEERDMASQNGGHITKSEQRVLNQQENAVSGRIGQ